MHTDPRLQQYVEHIREAELVQAYGRGRTLTNNKIGVYIICSLEIPMETRKRTLNELLGQPTTRNKVALALLLQLGGNKGYNYSHYYNRLRRRNPFRGYKNPSHMVIKTLKNLIKAGYIKHDKQKGIIKLTPNGRMQIKYEILTGG